MSKKESHCEDCGADYTADEKCACVLVAAEMVVGTGTGLGYSIIQARWTLDYTSSFACIAVICLVGLLTEHLFLRQLEKQTIMRWVLTTEKR